MEEIKEKLRAFIQEKFEIDDDPDFTDDVHLFNEGFVDSFGAVEIIHFIEQTYNIEITQKDITLYPMNTIEMCIRDRDTLMLIKYLADEAKEDKLLENPQLFKTPIVRNGRQATVGYKPEVWKIWE